MLLQILIVIAVLLLFILALLMLRTALYLKAPEPIELAPELETHPELVAEHLGSAIRCETVSALAAPTNRSAFLQLHRVLERWYPRTHEFLLREYINEYSLLYTWKGTNPDLPGILLLAHQDVVPADPATLDAWDHDPFSGEIADDSVWGRGALDLKSQLVAILDAVESLLQEGYRPERNIYLAFGHDEELGGSSGAAAVLETLQARGVELDAVLDEGAAVLAGGTLWGVDLPVGLIGVGEKGMLTLRLTVDTQPGHSSMPPSSTAIGILSRAIVRLEQNPMPVQLRHLRDLYRSLGAAASFGTQLMFANLWLFGGAVKGRLSEMPEANALARTTSAVTMVSGGIKENVLPQRAEALVSMRLLPGDSVQKVCAHARNVIVDPRVQLEAVAAGTWEASAISDISSPEYESLRDTIRRVFGGVAVAPFLAVGATDARRFSTLCPNIFRFTPYTLTRTDIQSIHGANEHISLAVLARMVQFYVELIKTWG